jgi:hypothetical protein
MPSGQPADARRARNPSWIYTSSAPFLIRPATSASLSQAGQDGVSPEGVQPPAADVTKNQHRAGDRSLGTKVRGGVSPPRVSPRRVNTFNRNFRRSRPKRSGTSTGSRGPEPYRHVRAAPATCVLCGTRPSCPCLARRGLVPGARALVGEVLRRGRRLEPDGHSQCRPVRATTRRRGAASRLHRAALDGAWRREELQARLVLRPPRRTVFADESSLREAGLVLPPVSRRPFPPSPCRSRSVDKRCRRLTSRGSFWRLQRRPESCLGVPIYTECHDLVRSRRVRLC